ncbi:MAG TPA: branched-chain amino acid ABC transporter permease, partial [Candidatus Eisenbacteria bacterium]|nr:branched-chain amino acid ABC transporter permease [Candidatus Eisenbacteria bacterium]
FFQQVITGLSNGMIIALIALGYTMVYGIVELINFAHGDLFMLGTFLALTIVGMIGASTGDATLPAMVLMFLLVPVFCGTLNWSVDRLAYRPLRNAPKLAPLVAAIGVSFIFMNLGQFWGGLPMDVFGGGMAAAAPKNFPPLIPNTNVLTSLGFATSVQFTLRDLLVWGVTAPLLFSLTLFVRYTRLGKAMRATAQNPVAAQLLGIDVNRVIGATFMIGGALGGFAAVIYPLFNPTIHFQLGYRSGMDAFTAAVLGGIGNLPGAMLGGILIGLVRSMSDQYIETRWTNAIVFSILILILIFRPNGLLGARTREKV